MVRFVKIFFPLVLINFFVFIAVSLWLGGDAINGHSGSGHYFLGSHGRVTEVSHDVFVYSWWHTVSVMVTMPLGLLVQFFSNKIEKAQARERGSLKAL